MSNIASALFTKTQQQLLSILYGKPDTSFYLNEIVRLSSVGKGAVARDIKKMSAAGLLESRKVGNQIHYQANQKNPIFDELCSITRKTFGAVNVIRQALHPALNQIDKAFIYGSVAKGEDHANSDVDVLLIGEDLSYCEIMELLEPAEQQLGRTINPTIYTAEEFQQREDEQQSFITRVMSQPKLWLTAPSQSI